MYDYASIQAEIDYRRDRLTLAPDRRGKAVRRTRTPFVGIRESLNRRVR
ncbi:hypothetical protein ABFT23_03955 [Nocardioides sp. C4-1]